MVIERTFNIPLRSGFRETTRYKKTKKAVTTLKEFLVRHMKSDNIRIGRNLNNALWIHGIKNPPHHVKVVVIKEDDGTVKAELFGHKYSHQTKEEKESSKKEETTKQTKSEKTSAKAEKTDSKETKKHEHKTEKVVEDAVNEKNDTADDKTESKKDSAKTEKSKK